MKTLKGAMSITRLIGAVIVAVILGALIGTVADSTIGCGKERYQHNRDSNRDIDCSDSVVLGDCGCDQLRV